MPSGSPSVSPPQPGLPMSLTPPRSNFGPRPVSALVASLLLWVVPWLSDMPPVPLVTAPVIASLAEPSVGVESLTVTESEPGLGVPLASCPAVSRPLSPQARRRSTDSGARRTMHMPGVDTLGRGEGKSRVGAGGRGQEPPT
jgi:hypothetical protein